MSGKRRDIFPEIIVGVFMLAVLLLLSYFTIVISGVDVLKGEKKIVARIVFNQVGGLKTHDNVMYRGTKVGSVQRIDLQPTNVVVSIEIDNSVILREKYRAYICNMSMLGGNYLALEEGLGEELPLEKTMFVGETPTNWMRDVAQIAKNLEEITSGVSFAAILTNLEATTTTLREMTERVAAGEGSVGKLLVNEDLYQEVIGITHDVRRIVDKFEDIAPFTTFSSLLMGGF